MESKSLLDNHIAYLSTLVGSKPSDLVSEVLAPTVDGLNWILGRSVTWPTIVKDRLRIAYGLAQSTLNDPGMTSYHVRYTINLVLSLLREAKNDLHSTTSAWSWA